MQVSSWRYLVDPIESQEVQLVEVSPSQNLQGVRQFSQTLLLDVFWWVPSGQELRQEVPLRYLFEDAWLQLRQLVVVRPLQLVQSPRQVVQLLEVLWYLPNGQIE